jgi:hypothetical protein
MEERLVDAGVAVSANPDRDPCVAVQDVADRKGVIIVRDTIPRAIVKIVPEVNDPVGSFFLDAALELLDAGEPSVGVADDQ